ncbi:Theobromine synthase [Bertholletia excelsa]
MNRGEGESSYARNSSFPQKVASIAMPLLQKAIDSLFSKDFQIPEVFNAADLGCAAGPNTYAVISTIRGSVAKKCRELNCQTPETQVYLNDLPGNDFNTLFKGLSKSQELSCFVVGAPGSFHGRLFPRNAMHVIYSCNSIHWLSQPPKGLTGKEGQPLNKGKIYISKTSPPGVREAYIAQFQEDITAFLKARSQEMVPHGRMVLILYGRSSTDPTSKENSDRWELLAEAISEMVSQGLIDEEKLDSFNIPYYTPWTEEVKGIVEREGSFKIELFDSFVVGFADVHESLEKYAKATRAFTESVLANQFGDQSMDKLYGRFAELAAADWGKEATPKATSFVLVLSKKTVA